MRKLHIQILKGGKLFEARTVDFCMGMPLNHAVLDALEEASKIGGTVELLPPHYREVEPWQHPLTIPG